jgi:hypothetical protein
MLQEVVTHATLGALFRYWDKKRGARRMPARRDIDPIEMDRRFLPHLMLCEVAEDGDRIRFRLVGTALVKRLGIDPTGRFLADLPPGKHFEFLAKLLRRVHAQAVPIYGESVFRWGLKGRLEARQLLLPLSASSAATIVLVGTAYSSSDVFPPPILELNLVAKHAIVKCQGVKTPAPEPRRKAGSANVA